MENEKEIKTNEVPGDGEFVSKKDFMALVEEIKKLKNGEGPQRAVNVKEGDRIATIKIYKGLLVTSLKNFVGKSIIGESGNKEVVQMVDIYGIGEDNKEVKIGTVDYLHFLNNIESVKIRLVKVVQVIDKSISAGLYDSQNPNPVENKSFMSSPVNLTVEMKERIFEAVVLDGEFKDRTIKISENSLNM